MSTALALDLFEIEQETSLDNELFLHINDHLSKIGFESLTGKSVVVRVNDSEIKVKINGYENEKSENKMKNIDGSFFRKQKFQIENSEIKIDFSENEIAKNDQIRKNMIKGYMSLLSK